MKVYIKKEDRNTTILGIIALIVFLSISIGIFIIVFKSDKPFYDLLDSNAFPFMFAIAFFGFSLYIIYILVKKPKYYKSKLIDKKNETYNGKIIINMKFITEKEKEQEEDYVPSTYMCYTSEENNLIVGNDYLLKIKEYNWEPKYVEEMNNSYVSEKSKEANKIPNMTMAPVFFSIRVILGGVLLLCIFGIIIYPKRIFSYLISIIILTVALFATFIAGKHWDKDNDLSSDDTAIKLKLEKIKPLENTQEKINNTAIKYLLILLVAFPILWAIFLYTKNIDKDSFLIAFSMILFVELPIIIMLLYNIDFEKRLIRKNKLIL